MLWGLLCSWNGVNKMYRFSAKLCLIQSSEICILWIFIKLTLILFEIQILKFLVKYDNCLSFFLINEVFYQGYLKFLFFIFNFKYLNGLVEQISNTVTCVLLSSVLSVWNDFFSLVPCSLWVDESVCIAFCVLPMWWILHYFTFHFHFQIWNAVNDFLTCIKLKVNSNSNKHLISFTASKKNV